MVSKNHTVVFAYQFKDYVRHAKPMLPYNPMIATPAAPAVITEPAKTAPATKRPTAKDEPPMQPKRLAPPSTISISSKVNFLVSILINFKINKVRLLERNYRTEFSTPKKFSTNSANGQNMRPSGNFYTYIFENDCQALLYEF